MSFDLPPERDKAYRKALRLEWLTILFFASAVTVIYLALGSSQAMKAAWIEDMLAFVPPMAFLFADRVRNKEPDAEFPYGHHRAISIGFLAAALSLLLLGLFILHDSTMKLIAFEHTPVGLVQPFGSPVWLGWFMIAALTYTMFPAVILGRMKLPLARQLHDKILYADAQMNKADWMTAGAAIIGVLGLWFGIWWLDPLAAIFIGASIVSDGFRTTRTAVHDLMDSRPRLPDDSAVDPLPARIETELRAMPWVKDVSLRVREVGHLFYGEAFVVPARHDRLAVQIDQAIDDLRALDWRLHDISITPVTKLEQPQDRERPA